MRLQFHIRVWKGLLPNPPSVEELAAFFKEAVDNYMVAESAAFLKSHPSA